MQTPNARGRWQAALAAAAALGLVWALWAWREPADGVADAGSRVLRAVPITAQAPQGRPLTAPAATRAPGLTHPPGVSAEQWDALVAELQRRPDGPAELQRLTAYFAWSDTLRRFREARLAGAPVADLVPLAQAVDAGLTERVRQAEVSAAEARQIKSALLALAVADESARAAQLQQWAAATFTASRPGPRQAGFERRQGEIVATWSAQPAAARDPAALTRDLDALRRETFSGDTR